MFYSREILTRRGPLARVWLAATAGQGRIGRRFALDAEIARLCDLLLNALVPMALRLKAHLLVGIVRIYRRKCVAVEKDSLNWYSAARARRRQQTNIDLDPGANGADGRAVTLAVAGPPEQNLLAGTPGFGFATDDLVHGSSATNASRDESRTGPNHHNGASRSFSVEVPAASSRPTSSYLAPEDAITLPDYFGDHRYWDHEDSQMGVEPLIGFDTTAPVPVEVLEPENSDNPFTTSAGSIALQHLTLSPEHHPLEPVEPEGTGGSDAIAGQSDALSADGPISTSPKQRTKGQNNRKRKFFVIDEAIVMSVDTVRLNVDMTSDLVRRQDDEAIPLPKKRANSYQRNRLWFPFGTNGTCSADCIWSSTVAAAMERLRQSGPGNPAQASTENPDAPSWPSDGAPASGPSEPEAPAPDDGEGMQAVNNSSSLRTPDRPEINVGGQEEIFQISNDDRERFRAARRLTFSDKASSHRASLDSSQAGISQLQIPNLDVGSGIQGPEVSTSLSPIAEEPDNHDHHLVEVDEVAAAGEPQPDSPLDRPIRDEACKLMDHLRSSDLSSPECSTTFANISLKTKRQGILFYSILVLTQRGFLAVRQSVPFGSIEISRGPKFDLWL